MYAVDNAFVTPAVGSLNCFLRDHYSGEVGQIDPQLLHLLHHVRRELGVQTPFQVISGYRSPQTNATLRNTRSSSVAKRSLHMEGQAIDVQAARRATGRAEGRSLVTAPGGVGFYPRDQFLHLDTGRVRNWQVRPANALARAARQRALAFLFLPRIPKHETAHFLHCPVFQASKKA